MTLARSQVQGLALLPNSTHLKNNFNIELSATSIKNLEKIEELFLYSIELNSKVKSQAKELQEKDSQIDDLEQRIERLEKLILAKKG